MLTNLAEHLQNLSPVRPVEPRNQARRPSPLVHSRGAPQLQAQPRRTAPRSFRHIGGSPTKPGLLYSDDTFTQNDQGGFRYARAGT
ncbi:hypothetical protein Areg01_78640 [Actinoplanes regularis]|nr:hypothetical protein Areg01_78640 [Actinoplanes regularis]